MKALVLTEYNCLSIEELPVPEIGREDVLVRVKACSICGSDVHGLDGSTGRRIPPVVMGHEASGIIEAVGCAVSQYQAGDRVTFDSTVYCQKCSFCKRGEANLCDNRRVIGVSCAEYRRNGAFAEYVAVPQHILYRLSDGLSFERAAMAEPLSIALHAVSRAPALLNTNAVVVGAGMIGLLIIQLLKLAGCRQIIAIDLVQEKLDLAVKFGATAVWQAGKAASAAAAAAANVTAAGEAICQLTDGTGADVAFEAVGLASTVQMAVVVLRKGGSLTLVGNLSPVAEIPLQAIVTREISLRGSCASAGEYAGSLDLIAAGKIDVDSFISAVAPLADGAAWFRRLYAGEPGLMKVILKP